MSWARRATVACAVLSALHLVVAVGFLAAEPNRTSWLTLAVGMVVVPAATGLSVLISRRREGATVGVLLGLLSLAVAHVVAKEIWLQWLATTDDPDRWSWLVAVTAEDAWWILTTFGLLLLHFPDGRRAVTPLALGPGDDGDRCGGHPGPGCARRRAVPGTAGRPGPPVRSASGLVGAALPGRVRGDAPAHRGLRGVAGAAVPACRPHPAPADQVARAGRDRHAALPAALPARDRDLGRAAVVQRGRGDRFAGRHPGCGGDRGAPARPLRRRQGTRARRHLGAGHRAAARRLRGSLVGGRRADRPGLRDRRRDRYRGGGTAPAACLARRTAGGRRPDVPAAPGCPRRRRPAASGGEHRAVPARAAAGRTPGGAARPRAARGLPRPRFRVVPRRQRPAGAGRRCPGSPGRRTHRRPGARLRPGVARAAPRGGRPVQHARRGRPTPL